jgi:hypothetical protein
MTMVGAQGPPQTPLLTMVGALMGFAPIDVPR